MAYEKMPIRHPEILTSLPDDGVYDTAYFEKIFGIVYCTVMPPRDEPIGVLPCMINGRVIFPLCRTCAETAQQFVECEHGRDERMINGIWTTIELHEATIRGYIVITIHEQWHYPHTMTYSEQEGVESGLFTEYMMLWQKLKLESSGYPPGVTTETAKRAHVDKVRTDYRIMITMDDIEFNAGVRSTAKLCGNTLFGSLAENSKRSKTVMITKSSEIARYFCDGRLEINSVIGLGDNALLNYTPIEEVVQPLSHTSIVHAMFITAYGRMKLYHELRKVGLGRLLYSDTDSILYVRKRDTYDIPLGSGPGKWTNALQDEFGVGVSGSKFVATGAKSYAVDVVTANGELVDVHLKCKGITQDDSTGKQLNFNRLLDIIHQYMGTKDNVDPIIIKREQILRTKLFQVYSKLTHKRLNVTLGKRTINHGSSITLPYGHMLQGTPDIDQYFDSQ
jgi:hypothetical protein